VELAAVGIVSSDASHSLGLREGATEKATACKELLADLIERGLNPDRAILVLVDDVPKPCAWRCDRSPRGARVASALSGA